MSIRLLSLYAMAIVYIFAGIMHFITPKYYLKIMPKYLPYHLELVYLSGVSEIICGLLLMFKRTQILGAWLTIALLIAVFPANIQMAQDFLRTNHPQKLMSIIRLPIQFVLIYWAYQYTQPISHIKMN